MGDLWPIFAEAEFWRTSLFLKALKLSESRTLANSQIPKSNPGPKAPKAKRFRIPRVQRLKLQSHNPL